MDPLGDPGLATAPTDPLGDPGIRDPLGDPGMIPITVPQASTPAGSAPGLQGQPAGASNALVGGPQIAGVTQTPAIVTSAAVETEGQKAYKAEINKALYDVENIKSFESLVTGAPPAKSSFMVKAGKTALSTAAMNAPAAGFSYYGRHILSRDLERADQMTPEERTASAQEVARAYQMAREIEPEEVKTLSDFLASALGTVVGFAASPGAGIASIGSKIAKKVLPQVAARTLGQKVLKGAATGAGAGLAYGAAEMPVVTPTETAGEIAGQKVLQTIETTAGFAAFGAGSAAAAHLLPKVFYQQYDWTPERFQKEFPDMVRRVAANRANEGEVRLVQDVNAYLDELGQKPGPYARGKTGLDVQASERRAWVDMIPVLRDALSKGRKVNITGGTPPAAAEAVVQGPEPGGEYDQRSQGGIQGIQSQGQELGRPIPERGPGGAPVERGGILQAQKEGIPGQIQGGERGPAPGPALTFEERLTAVGYNPEDVKSTLELFRKRGMNDVDIDDAVKDIEYSVQQSAASKVAESARAAELARQARANPEIRAREIAARGVPDIPAIVEQKGGKLGPWHLVDKSKARVTRVAAPLVAVRPELMQFKDFDEAVSGTVNKRRLKGPWDEFKSGLLLLWEPANPAEYGLTGNEKYIAANGHYRVDLGTREGVKEYNVQIIREADGFTPHHARILAAEINIADGKGTIYDQVNLLRNIAGAYGTDAALEAGDRTGPGGRKATTIAFKAAPRADPGYAEGSAGAGKPEQSDLIDAFTNERITPDQAEVIADVAPNDAGWQAVGIKQAIAKMPPEELRNFLNAAIRMAKASAMPQTSQGDLFGNVNDAAYQAAIAQGKAAEEIKKGIKIELEVVRAGKRAGAAKRKDLAKKYGISVTDPGGLKAVGEKLAQELERWEHWAENEDLVAQVYAKLGLAAPGAQPAAPGPAPAPAAEDIVNDLSVKPKSGSAEYRGGPAGGAQPKLDLAGALADLGAEMKSKTVQGPVQGVIVEGAAKTVFRVQLENIAASKREAAARMDTDQLLGQEIQRKAAALIDALDAGRIKEPEAQKRWTEFTAQAVRGKAKLDKAAAKLQAGEEQGVLFPEEEKKIAKQSGELLTVGVESAQARDEKEYALIQKGARVLKAWAAANGVKEITPEMFDKALGEHAERLAGIRDAILETANAEMKGVTAGAGPAGAPEPAVPVPGKPEESEIERTERMGMFQTGADYGIPAPALPPADDPGYSIFPIEMPELVQIARQLTGKYPRVKRRLGRALGRFKWSGDESEIEIKASTFGLVTTYEKAEILQKVATEIMGQPGEMGGPDPAAAKKLIKEEYERQVELLRTERAGKPAWYAASVLAHELGHAADWDPLHTVEGRGNIFAHIATLHNFMMKTFPAKPGDDEGLAPEIRKEIRAAAQKEAWAELGKNPDEKELAELIKKIYAEKIEAALEAEGLVKYNDVIEELRSMIAWWHGTEEIPEYFDRTPHEMYAETLSVLLNNPAAVQKRAPNFYKMFYAYMARKPEFRAAYEKVMEDIKTSALYPNRDRIMREDMKQSAKDMQSWADKMNERTWREWKDITRRQVDRELGPLEQRIVKIADKDLMGTALGSMERYLYRAPMQNGALLRMENDVMRPLFKAGLEIIDFDEYLFHLRVLLDRPAAGEIARPWGYNRKSSGEMLAEMRKRSGQAFNVMEELQKKFRAVYKEEALDRLRHYNIYGDEMMADLDARDAYATFQVNRLGTPPEDTLKAMFETRFGSGITSHIFKQYGTLFPVASPYTATVQKMMRLISMAERENMKYSVLNGLMSAGSPFKEEWQPAEEVFDKGEQRMQIKIIDNDKVGTVTVLHDGKLTGYYGPRVLVDALMFARPDEVQMWMKVAFTAFNIQKGILTRFNPTFIARNVQRDIRTYNILMPGTSRDWMNWVPGLPGGAWSRYAYPAFKAAVSIYRGRPNVIGQDALRRGFVGQQGVYYGGNALAGSEQKLQSLGHAPDKVSVIKFMAQVVRDVIAAAGPVSESMTKINGMIRMDRRSTEPEWKKLIAAHTWAGSPNFWQKGAGSRMIELVRMFFNPWKEGMRSLGWAFKGGGGWEGRPWETTLNMIRRTLIPRLGLYLLLGGGIGLILKKRFDEMPDGVKQYQDGPSDFDRRNSHCLPLGWYDRAEHKVMYLTLPLSENERVFSAAFDVLLRSTVGDLSEAPKLKMLSDLMAYTAGQLPGINPVIGTVVDWSNYMTGGNPYDEYRMRFALNENQAQVRGLEGLKAMLQYTGNQLFGSIAGPIEQPRVDELPKSKWEKILSHTPGIRGYVKISNNGYRERMRNSTLPTLDRQAEIRIEEDKMILRLRAGGKLTQDEFIQLIEGAALDESFKTTPIPLPAELELQRYYWIHFKYLMDKAGIAYAPPEIRNYIRQPTRALKSAVLKEILK